MFRYPARWAALALATLARADSPQSAQNLKQLSLEQLSQIEVTSPTKEPQSAFQTNVAIYVITGDEIRRSGATTIPEALRLAPGVEVARIDSNKWSVGIRGFGTRLSRSVLVLIDGRTVYTTLFAGTYWEVQDTLLEDIDRIEVIRGPGGTIWGPNAVNGVINIITRHTKDTQGVFAEAGGGNREQGFANFRYGGSHGGLTYRLYAKAFTRAPEVHFDTDNFDDWRGGQSGFRMDWSHGDRDTFTVQGDIYRQEDGERVDLASYNPIFQKTFDGNAELSGGNVVARWNHKFSDRSDVVAQAYYDRTDRFEPNFGERRDTYDLDFTFHTQVAPRHLLIYGAEGRLSHGRFDEVASGLVFSPASRLDHLFSGFLEDDITLVDQELTLSLGSKILSTNYTGVEFEPSVRLMWTPSERHTLWAAMTHAVRTPSRVETEFYLSSFFGTNSGLPFFARFNANPDFAPEQLNGYELGYRTLLAKNLYIDIATFWNHYHDLFSQDITGPIAVESSLPFPPSQPVPVHLLLPAEFGNDLYGFTTGGEIAPEWRPSKSVRLRASYSYLNMNLSTNARLGLGASPASVVGSSPRHEVSAQSSFDLPKKFQLDMIFRYVSALPAVSAPAYSTGDARLAWRFHPHIEFSVVGRNLFQPQHVEYAADPGGPVAIRRSVYAALAWMK